MATGFVWHERYMWHNTGRASGPFLSDASGWLEPDWRHAENSDTKRRFRNLLDVSGLLDQLVRIEPRPATVEEVLPLPHGRVRRADPGAVGRGRRRGDRRLDRDRQGLLRGRAARRRRRDRGGRRGARRRRRQRLRARAPARPPRAPRRGDGLLPLRQHRGRRAPRAPGARAVARRDRRLGRPPRQRHAGRVLRRPDAS